MIILDLDSKKLYIINILNVYLIGQKSTTFLTIYFFLTIRHNKRQKRVILIIVLLLKIKNHSVRLQFTLGRCVVLHVKMSTYILIYII